MLGGNTCVTEGHGGSQSQRNGPGVVYDPAVVMDDCLCDLLKRYVLLYALRMLSLCVCKAVCYAGCPLSFVCRLSSRLAARYQQSPAVINPPGAPAPFFCAAFCWHAPSGVGALSNHRLLLAVQEQFSGGRMKR